MAVKKKEKGFTLMEIMIAAAIMSIALASLMEVMIFSLQTMRTVKQLTGADALLQETMEATRNFRDNTEWGTDGPGSLSLNTDYHPEKDGSGAWTMVSGSESVGEYTRKVVFEPVNRESDGDIVEVGGTVDSDTLKVVAVVSWEDQTEEIVTYLTNWESQ